MTSEKLYDLCAQNDGNGWAWAYNYVITFLKSFTGPGPDMEDVTQDTLTYFMGGGLKKLKKKTAFKKWLRLKAKGFFIDRYRRNTHLTLEPLQGRDKGGETAADNPHLPAVKPDCDTRLFLEEALVVLEDALKAINNRCEKLLKRYFKARLLGEKTAAIAKEFNLPPNTVRVNIHRCQKKLLAQPSYQKLLEEYRMD